MFRIGPVVSNSRVWYIIRGEKGATTYCHYDTSAVDSDAHGFSSLERCADFFFYIPSKNPANKNGCEWIGNIPCYCDGRSMEKIDNESEIWEMLEKEYHFLHFHSEPLPEIEE